MDFDAVRLTIQISVGSTLIAVLVGVPFSWWLSRKTNWLRNTISQLVILPMVLPPTVLGYYLLQLFGRNSFIGNLLDSFFGLSLVFNWVGAVIAAFLVSAPFLIKIVHTGMENIDPKLAEIARTTGMSELSIFFTVILPVSWKYIIAGAALCLARSMGECGATIMVAGSIPGRTKTLSLAIYDEVQAGNISEANVMAITLSLIAFGLLIISTIVLRGKRSL